MQLRPLCVIWPTVLSFVLFLFMSSDAKSILGTIYKVSLSWIYHSYSLSLISQTDIRGHEAPHHSSYIIVKTMGETGGGGGGGAK